MGGEADDVDTKYVQGMICRNATCHTQDEVVRKWSEGKRQEQGSKTPKKVAAQAGIMQKNSPENATTKQPTNR